MEIGDGLVIALELGVQETEQIKRVGVGRELGSVGESVDAFLGVAEILVNETEVVPSVRIQGKVIGGIGESGASRIEFLLREKRDAEIEACDVELGIRRQSLLEEFLRVSRSLPVQIGDAEGIQPVGVGGFALWSRGIGGWRFRPGRREPRMQELCSAKQESKASDEQKRGAPKSAVHEAIMHYAFGLLC